MRFGTDFIVAYLPALLFYTYLPASLVRYYVISLSTYGGHETWLSVSRLGVSVGSDHLKRLVLWLIRTFGVNEDWHAAHLGPLWTDRDHDMQQTVVGIGKHTFYL